MAEKNKLIKRIEKLERETHELKRAKLGWAYNKDTLWPDEKKAGEVKNEVSVLENCTLRKHSSQRNPATGACGGMGRDYCPSCEYFKIFERLKLINEFMGFCKDWGASPRNSEAYRILGEIRESLKKKPCR